MQIERPDPDQLLAEVKAQEAAARRGRLRIYFDASAGVGKTYAMLVAAQTLRRAGSDVVIGVLETHGRVETAALLDGLEQLPPLLLDVHGAPIKEFNLDAALVRHPALILVDELAHTNAPGARHPKRWQDIDELLASGIDVSTTLNVQHVESLNDVVGGITGIRVWETVPDTFFDEADDVVLVDIPADELLARLKAGKVYMPEQVEGAAENFFRKGNLMALRELALRRTADRVEDDVQAYRTDQAIQRIWKTEASLLCCVGPDPGGEHVVRSAARLANQLAIEWTATYVETPKLQRLPPEERERILKTLKLAQDLGAKTAILSGSDPASTIVEYTHIHNYSKLVVGRAQTSGKWPWSRSVATRLGALAPDVDVVSDHDPSIAADLWRGALQVQAPPDSVAAIPEHRLPIEKLGREVPRDPVNLSQGVDRAEQRPYHGQPYPSQGAARRARIAEHAASLSCRIDYVLPAQHARTAVMRCFIWASVVHSSSIPSSVLLAKRSRSALRAARISSSRTCSTSVGLSFVIT
jgi:two-component system sensor histidine kinase KdpD